MDRENGSPTRRVYDVKWCSIQSGHLRLYLKSMHGVNGQETRFWMVTVFYLARQAGFESYFF